MPTSYNWIEQRWYPLNFNATAVRMIQRTATNPAQYLFKDWVINDNNYINKLYSGLGRDSLKSDFASVQVISDNTDFDNLRSEGNYLITNSSGNNNPMATTGFLTVHVADSQYFVWVTQDFCDINFTKIYKRVLRYSKASSTVDLARDWKEYLTNKAGRDNLKQDYNSVSILRNNEDFNTLKETGIYINTVTTNPNSPMNTSGILEVKTFYNTGNDYRWIVQTYNDIQLTKKYERVIRERMIGEPAGEILVDSDWKLLYNFGSQDGFGLSGKKIVNFGDSIFGNYRGVDSVSNNIASITKAEVINVGFGGCRMSDRGGTTWNAFSMCNLATAIANQDFTMQDDAIANTGWSDRPDYFAQQLQTLKDIDFSEVDYITIAYGTNDYTGGTLLDNTSDELDQTTWAGALRYTIQTLLNAYPNLRILIGSPIWRCWLNSQTQAIEYTSDDRTFTGNYTLKDMTDKTKEIGLNYHIPVLDAYNNLCLNRYNYTSFFILPDTTHPNPYGRACLGKEYAYALLNM